MSRKEADSITQPRKAHYLAGCMNSISPVDLASMHHLTFYWDYFNVVICNEPPPRLTLTDFLQVPFMERTIMPVIRAERKIEELKPKAANAQVTIDWL